MSRLGKAIAATAALAMLQLGGIAGSQLVGTAHAASTALCGANITSNLTLTDDVGPCNNGDGLVVTGSNFTINLNGHRVFSNATLPRNAGCVQSPTSGALPVPVPCSTPQPPPQANRPVLYIAADVVGIHLLDATNVSVRNGTVEGFSAGVAIEGGDSNTIFGVTAQNNHAPCIGENFTTQAVGTYGDGFVIFSSTNNHIQNNQSLNNGPFSGISVVANTVLVNQPVNPLATGNEISNNNVQDSADCFGEIGIRLEGPGASNNVVRANTVNHSFLEGIAALSVNIINFSGVFANPPTCQNRGFPFNHTGNFAVGSTTVTLTTGTFSASDLGQTVNFPGVGPQFPAGPAPTITAVTSPTTATISVAPISSGGGLTGVNFSTLPLCPLNRNGRSNDNNVIQGNTVTRNGGGGTQTSSGPGLPPGVSIQVRPGINLLAFCGYGTLNGKGTNVSGNTSTLNFGDGILVGGCSTTSFNTVGWHDNQILGNTSVNNNQSHCPHGAPAACGATFDLHDTSAGNTCDNNIWRGNRYGTADPPCTTIGGTQISSGTTTATSASGVAAEGSSRGSAPRLTRTGRVVG
jgi:hypothetical protein